jgi:hypothetical protein
MIPKPGIGEGGAAGRKDRGRIRAYCCPPLQFEKTIELVKITIHQVFLQELT